MNAAETSLGSQFTLIQPEPNQSHTEVTTFSIVGKPVTSVYVLAQAGKGDDAGGDHIFTNGLVTAIADGSSMGVSGGEKVRLEGSRETANTLARTALNVSTTLGGNMLGLIADKQFQRIVAKGIANIERDGITLGASTLQTTQICYDDLSQVWHVVTAFVGHSDDTGGTFVFNPSSKELKLLRSAADRRVFVKTQASNSNLPVELVSVQRVSVPTKTSQIVVECGDGYDLGKLEETLQSMMPSDFEDPQSTTMRLHQAAHKRSTADINKAADDCSLRITVLPAMN